MPTYFPANFMPVRADLDHDEANVVIGNALAVTIDTGQVNNYFARQNPSANSNEFTQSVFLRAGVYAFSVLGQTNANNGLVDWYLGGALFAAAQDWYSGAQVKNVIKTAAVTLTADGYFVLRGVVNGKNGASGGYNLDFTKYWFRQATD